jgi:hypothetical protein
MGRFQDGEAHKLLVSSLLNITTAAAEVLLSDAHYFIGRRVHSLGIVEAATSRQVADLTAGVETYASQGASHSRFLEDVERNRPHQRRVVRRTTTHSPHGSPSGGVLSP